MNFILLLLLAFLIGVIVLSPAIFEVIHPKDNKPLFINQNYFADLKFFLNRAKNDGLLEETDIIAKNGDKDIATTKNVRIATDTTVHHWVHCNELFFESNCFLKGKATANKVILSKSVKFQRISAHEINHDYYKNKQKIFSWELDDLHNAVFFYKKEDLKKGLLIIDNEIDQNIVVKGNILIKKGVNVRGSIKANGSITIEDDVCIMGSVFSEENITIGNECTVWGHVVAEKILTIGEQFQGGYVGDNEKPITLIGYKIFLKSFILNGTIWAKDVVQISD